MIEFGIRNLLGEAGYAYGGTTGDAHKRLVIEQLRQVDAALDPDETILPPLLIQPFIENAIWHGMNGEEKEINILVEFRKKGDQLICTIEDDGIGIDQSTKMKNGKNGAHQSVSIANIQKRIELLNRKHDLQSSISIKDKNLEEEYSGTGTIVSITLPLEIKEE